MFTIQQIQEAHSKVKSGADFPDYIKELIKLGVTGYETFVTDGRTVYSGSDNFIVKSEGKYAALNIADSSDREKFERRLKSHQQGESDYPTFCADSAEAGVEKWKVDTNAMTCTYYNKAGDEILKEKIPS